MFEATEVRGERRIAHARVTLYALEDLLTVSHLRHTAGVNKTAGFNIANPSVDQVPNKVYFIRRRNRRRLILQTISGTDFD